MTGKFLKTLATLSVLVLAGSFLTWMVTPGMGLNPVERDLANENWKVGECASCHEESQDLANSKKTSWSHPDYHSSIFKNFEHGGERGDAGGKCFTCHAASSCRDCHSHAPDSHIAGFRNPQDLGDGLKLHILLGQADQGSCVFCHQDSLGSCYQCHSRKEVSQWNQNAKNLLGRWPELNKAFKAN